MQFRNKNGIYFEASKLLAEQSSIEHAFLTRVGGKSKGPFESLNLSRAVKDAPESVEENFRLLGEAFNVSEFLTVGQIHGTDILFFNSAREEAVVFRSREADGIITSVPGVAIGVRTADCLPLLMYDPKNKAIAAVHAGWRGTVCGIGRIAVKAMNKHVGSEPQDIIASIGPCIRSCCFEVGSDVAEKFEREFGDEVISRKAGSARSNVDVALSVRKSLLSASVRTENIDDTGICTMCNEDYFYSHRRDGTPSGRHLNFIMLKG